MHCLFASDLHGHDDQYSKLFAAIEAEKPRAVFIGGDLLPSPFASSLRAGGVRSDFVLGYLADELEKLRRSLSDGYPRVFVVLGNDDPRVEEESFLQLDRAGLLHYAHQRHYRLKEIDVYGYAFVPPSPFRLKDWERYDVSRYVDPGCTAPVEGMLTVSVPEHELQYRTIQEDLEALVGDRDLSRAVMLFHTPPYETNLDRAALDGRKVDGVQMDVHVGSIAVRRLIEARQPRVTMHGHVHESARLTGSWRDVIGRTQLYSAAHDGPELALVSFDTDDPAAARRRLI